jgi:hypothetical protein
VFTVGSLPGKERKRDFADTANGLYSAQASPKPPAAMYMITEGMKVGGKVQRTGISEGTFPLCYITTDLILCFCYTEEGHCSPGARLCEKGLERDTGKTPVSCSLIRYLSTSTY